MRGVKERVFVRHIRAEPGLRDQQVDQELRLESRRRLPEPPGQVGEGSHVIVHQRLAGDAEDAAVAVDRVALAGLGHACPT